MNALGTANYSLVTNGSASALTWHLHDIINNKHFAIAANTNLNDLLTPGVYCCESGTTVATLTNKPANMDNGAFLMIVRYITGNYWQQEIINNENKRWSRQYQISGTTWSDWVYLTHPFLQCARRQASTQTINVNTTTKLDFNGVNYTSYSVESGYGWDTTNSCFVAPFKGNFVFRLDAIFYYKYTTDEVDPIYNSVNYMKFTLYKNNSAVSDKNMMNLNGKALRPGLMWFWIAEKGDVFDVRVYSKTALTMPNSVNTPNNYEDSALYIWSV